MKSLEQISPNTDPATVGDRYVVKTEAHELTFEVRPVGPQTKGYIVALAHAEPPITSAPFYMSEIYVDGHEVKRGEVFELSSLFPIMTETAFRAIEITEDKDSTEQESPSAFRQ